MKVLGTCFCPRFWIGLLLLICLGVASCKQQQKNPATDDIRRDATVRAVEEVMPSVVNIATGKEVISEEKVLSGGLLRYRQFYDTPQERLNSYGSGVILTENGYVLTSLHVLKDATKVQVKLWDGRIYDCESNLVTLLYNDVALLKIHAPPGERFKPIRLAPDDDLLLGETVIALGNPLGLGGSVTKGILSSKSRRLPSNNGPRNYKDWLQTDAAINEGNSGGPLVNLLGEMIGLNEAVATNSQSIGFAIPVSQVQVAISQFFTPEVMNALWFGARVKAGNGLLRVNYLVPDSPATQAGLHVGDEIESVNGVSPGDPFQFDRALCGNSSNQDVTASLVIRRHGERHSLTVKMVSFDTITRQKIGLTLRKTQAGLAINSIEKNSPADLAQLREGFLIIGVDGQPVFDLLSATSFLSAKKSGDHTILTIVAWNANGEAVQAQANVLVR